MNIIKIVNDGLKLNGYSGLYQAGVCGCKVDDLSPGNCLDETCEPGHCHAHSTKNLWVIHQQKEPISDDVIEEINDY